MEAARSRGAVVMCGVLAGFVYREKETKETPGKQKPEAVSVAS